MDEESTSFMGWSINQLQNTREIRKNNTSGHKGVYMQGTKWIAQIQTNNIRKYLGSFVDINDAVATREKSKRGENIGLF